MSFPNYPFDRKPTDGFKRHLARRRQQIWQDRAKLLRQINTRPAVRKIFLSFFPQEFLAALDPVLHGDMLLAYAEPLNLVDAFIGAEGEISNYPIRWQGAKKAARLTDYLMHRVDVAYRKDPRFSDEQIQARRDLALLRLALAAEITDLDTQTYSHLRGKVQPLVHRFIAHRELNIDRAFAGQYVGIAPSL